MTVPVPPLVCQQMRVAGPIRCVELALASSSSIAHAITTASCDYSERSVASAHPCVIKHRDDST